MVAQRNNSRTPVRPRRRRLVAAVNRVTRTFAKRDVVNEILGSFKTLLTRPYIFILIAALVLFVYNHGHTITKGPLADHCKTSDTTFCSFVKKTPSKFLGILVSIPVALDLPVNVRYPFLAVFVLCVYFLNEIPLLAYVILLLLAHAFFRVRSTEARIILLMVAFAAYYFEAHTVLAVPTANTVLQADQPFVAPATPLPRAGPCPYDFHSKQKDQIQLVGASRSDGFADITYKSKRLKLPVTKCDSEGCYFRDCSEPLKYGASAGILDTPLFNSQVSS